MSPAPVSAVVPPSGLQTEMHRRIDEFDWASTSVGPQQTWSRSLTSTIKLLLGSRYPMLLLWGPELIQIYNEAYIKLIGDKHPEALGRSIRKTQAESWEVIGPMIHEVMSTGIPNWVPAQCLPLERAGYREESYFSLSYSAVDDDRGDITGMLCVCSEVTEQVLGERRLRLLRDLSIKAGETHSVSVTCKSIASVLGDHPFDVPFALLYLPDAGGRSLVLESSIGVRAEASPLPARIELGQGGSGARELERAFAGELVRLDLTGLGSAIAGGPFGDAARHALAIPLRGSPQAAAFGVLVAGRSPNRALDDNYASFYELLASQVSLAMRNARAYEDERRRAGAESKERARSESMLGFLADASAALAETLDYPVTMARVARLSVPILADWCFIDIVNELGVIERVEVAHADPADAEHALAIKAFPAASTGNRDNPPTRAWLEGRAVLLQDVDEAQLRSSSHSEEHLAVMQRLGIRSFMSVPLEARGRILGCLSLATSKSGRRYAEADLALARDLARRCALAVDNARLYAEAQRAVSARDQFLSIASHELKTPLTPLNLQLHTLARKAGQVAKDEPSREWLAAKIAMLQRQSVRLDRIVTELLDVTRIAGARLRLTPERLDIKELAERVLAGFEQSGELEQSGCQLDFHAEQSVVGYWDHHHLEQVIRHLLENAIKFGAGKPVKFELERQGHWARLTVSDHGLGIALEDQARIFDRFERAVPERHYGGLGLGLWLVRSTVDAMGGTITVQSEPKKGATFIVELPIGEAP